MYDAFGSAQRAYDNMSDPRYDGPDADEDGARYDWEQDTPITDMLSECQMNDVLSELAFGNCDIAKRDLQNGIDMAWDKYKAKAFDDGH